jgi:hypothetical protein
MAATAGFTVAWSGAAAVCIGVVLVSALAVRSFWRYDASEPSPVRLRVRGATAQGVRGGGSDSRSTESSRTVRADRGGDH